jgi:hypothetical protein
MKQGSDLNTAKYLLEDAYTTGKQNLISTQSNLLYMRVQSLLACH